MNVPSWRDIAVDFVNAIIHYLLIKCDFYIFLFSRNEGKMKLHFLGFAAAEFSPILDEFDCFLYEKNDRRMFLARERVLWQTRVWSH